MDHVPGCVLLGVGCRGRHAVDREDDVEAQERRVARRVQNCALSRRPDRDHRSDTPALENVIKIGPAELVRTGLHERFAPERRNCGQDCWRSRRENSYAIHLAGLLRPSRQFAQYAEQRNSQNG